MCIGLTRCSLSAKKFTAWLRSHISPYSNTRMVGGGSGELNPYLPRVKAQVKILLWELQEDKGSEGNFCYQKLLEDGIMSRASTGSGLWRLLWNSPGGSISLELLATCRELESAEWRQRRGIGGCARRGRHSKHLVTITWALNTRVPHHQLPTATRKPVIGRGKRNLQGGQNMAACCQ